MDNKKKVGKSPQLRKCSVPQCFKKQATRVFGYPSNAKQKELWLQAFKLEHCKASDKVCDLHFKASDFGKRNLNYGVIPSQNLPQEFHGGTKLVGPMIPIPEEDIKVDHFMARVTFIIAQIF